MRYIVVKKTGSKFKTWWNIFVVVANNLIFDKNMSDLTMNN